MHWNLENDKFNLKLFSGLSMCQKCFLQTPMDQVEISIKQQNKTKCSGPHIFDVPMLKFNPKTV